MRARILTTIALVLVLPQVAHCDQKYQPTWESLDARPLPRWYDEAKFGIFSHWGVYSVPAHRSEWIWWYWRGEHDPEVSRFMAQHYPNGTTYQDLAKEFTAEDFDPNVFADIIKASGAKYFVLTSKHHEGFTMWPSATSWNWNSVDVGPHRDIVGDLSKSIRDKNLHFGLYFSQYDWFHPLYISDRHSNGTDFVKQVSYPQMLEIVNAYHPEVVWSDGDWEQSEVYWQSKEFLAWLYNDSPVKDVVAVNDRWGLNVMGHHGGFLTVGDKYDPGHLLSRKWESCTTLDKKSWGYRRDIRSEDVLTLSELVTWIARTISCGGNALLNVGPDKYGRIVPIFEDRLRQLGQFVALHEEAIFDTKPWIYQNDGNYTWYTSRVRKDHHLDPERRYNPQDTWNTIVYAFVLRLPETPQLYLPSVKPSAKVAVTLLGANIALPVKGSTQGITVDFTGVPWPKVPFREAIVLKIEFAGYEERNPLNDFTELEGFDGITMSKPTVPWK
ncbi:Protein W03G11.3 [Aphelenchoides avenae]|nr:Protein W03G11.3 [Aphelenchus avenae]